jgi:release factor glutamine methyltransferase
VTTLRELVDEGARQLRDSAGDAREDPRREARMLLEAAVGCDRRDSLVRSDDPVDPEGTRRFWDLVEDRARGIPLQILVGETAFHDVMLTVRAGVFIPRPETELLVEEVVIAVRNAVARASAQERPDGIRVLDLCTGTGAVAVAAASALRDEPLVSMHAADWNARAVHLARHNAKRCGVEVDVRRSNLFSAFADLEHRVAVISANPPYIDPAEAETLPLEVRLGDPRDALFDPEGGIGFHRRIADRGRRFLVDGGTLLLEMGETQADAIGRVLQDFGYGDVDVIPDLTGRDRFVRAVWKTGGEVPSMPFS